MDNLTGGAGNDIFTADNTGGAKQLSAADSINGGAGNDTLRVFNAAADAIDTQVLGTLTSIENVYLNSGTLTSGASFSVAGLAANGVTSFEVDSPVALATGSSFTFTMGAGQTLGLTKVNAVTGGTTAKINLAAASSVTSLTVNTNGDGTNTTNNGTVNLDVTGAGVTTLNLNAVTAASKITLANTGAALATINVTGTVGETVVVPLSTVNTINASTATGAVNFDVSGAARQAGFKFTGGTGNDTLTLAAGDLTILTSAAQLDGGAGNDTLVIKDVAPAYTALNLVKNFEVLGLGVTGITVDAAQLTGFKSFSFGAVGAETINNLGAGSTVTTTGNNTTVSLSAALGNSATSIVIGSATSTGITVGTLTVTGLTALGLASNGTAANTITTLSNSDNSAITVTGAAGLTVTSALAATTTGSKVDASALTGALSVIGSTKNDILIGGTGADRLQGAAANTANQADTLTGGAGADKFVFDSNNNLANLFADSAGTTAITKITDFVAGTDKIVLSYTTSALTSATVANAQTIATAADLTAVYAGITAITASTTTVASAAVITVTAGAAAGTYLYVNDTNAAVSNSLDMLINITGVSGTITAADFLFA